MASRANGRIDDLCDSEFLEDAVDEVYEAENVYPSMNSLHEAYAVIKEEVEEWWDEVKKKPAARDRKLLRKELVQVVAMCVRTARDLGLEDR